MRPTLWQAWLGCFLVMAICGSVSAQTRIVLQNENDEWRPKYHFTPPSYWMNDPNGLVFYQGEYHLFYQHNPLGLTSEHKSWAHAVSTDLVRWQHLGVALPEENGRQMYSGSVVVDVNNTSGLCQNPSATDKSCLVAIYTAHTPTKEAQHIAFSNDRGRTWTKYAGNPVVDISAQDFRDPKVFWHAATKQWVMVVAMPKEKKVRLYGAANLKAWKMLSEFGPAGVTEGVWECPDLFELPIEGSRTNKRWVLVVSTSAGSAAGGSGVQYFVGTFDGVKFTNDNAPTTKLLLNYGKDLYAAVTWSDIAPSDGRRILLGWMTNLQYASRQPTAPWRGMLSVPRVLTLRKTGEGVRLQQQPIAELQTLREKQVSYGSRQVVEGMPLLASEGVSGDALEIIAEFEIGKAKEFGFVLRAQKEQKTIVGYDVVKKELFIDRNQAGESDFAPDNFPGRHAVTLSPDGKKIRLQILLDRTSVEVFGNDGIVTLTDTIFPEPASVKAEIYVREGKVRLEALDVWRLKSALVSP
ncbi:MAG: glycoside hydrolase family 32 protein [Blastocatellia bacterium]